MQVATSDGAGRLVILDKSPARALLLDRRDRPDPLLDVRRAAIPNYAAWGPDGSLYVTDYAQAIVWRVPPRGGPPELWLADPRLDGDKFGTTGLELRADRRTLLVARAARRRGRQPVDRQAVHDPDPAGRHGRRAAQLWESQPADVPDGFAIARSGASTSRWSAPSSS